MQRHFRTIDYARGIAILMVIAVHSMQALRVCRFLSIGQMGVHIFFLVSGFGLSVSVEKKGFSDYFKRRFLSIAPAYWLTMVITVIPSIALSVISNGELGLGFAGNFSPLSVILNALLLHGFFPFCNNNVVGGGWYIGAAVILYAIFPLINKLFEKLEKLSFTIPIGFAVIALLLRFFANTYPQYYFMPDTDHFFVDQLVCFSLGMYMYRSIKTDVSLKTKSLYLVMGLPLLILCIISYYNPIPVISYLFKYLFGLSVFMIIKYFLIRENETEEKVSNNILCKFGRNSYYIFLSHPFFCYFMVHVVAFALKKLLGESGYEAISKEMLYLILLPFMIVLSYLSSFIIKYFADKLKNLMSKCLMSSKK